MLDTFKLHQKSVIGLKKTPIQNVSRFGAASGVFQRNDPNDDGTGADMDLSQLLEVKASIRKRVCSVHLRYYHVLVGAALPLALAPVLLLN